MTNLRLIDLLPPWYAETLDYQAICEAEQPMFDDVQQALAQLLLNMGWLTMDVDTVQPWEKALNIVPNPTYEDLDFRRMRVLNRLTLKPPFTLQFLHNKLDDLIGPALYSVEVDYPNYTLYIESNAQDQAYSQEVEFTVNRIKPAHITYIHRGNIIVDILVGEQVDYTIWGGWHYHLGQWYLGQKPFAEIQEQGVLKTPNQTSVQPAMLELLAGYTSDDVAAVRINGTVNIPTFNKLVVGNVLTVTYSVTPAMASTVTQAELLASDGTVLFNAQNIYLAVTDQVSVKHTVTIKEGA